ncbi:uncharacterized protein LOC116444334 isoform X1 [Corvus moneduloides]|uniref:uncharacterized protein LOC116444334 isoform X1 n=2 Tax=Corvus moneduloides TaxID=1196302 RepID=UPI0013644D70|nr:uncharacterized protein LOC116444334 isoform X1 [Corvus moneduloides]XP_031965533.1 uncharacterized protein LOC116444334 isoform X1 [Corvus moneduloides]XP_031965534.1 uncharacterized protein LOC116444334 isoform X1 [Corvus moneduloides]XP_031965535.1 uncharacterized protein LOC116444334 isoform X1 [Corvus moneduloides]
MQGGSWFTMEMMRDAKAWKLPPALDKYKSIYRKDFCWQDDYHSPTQAHVPTPSFLPVPDVPKCYLPECQPSDLTTRRAGKLEILADPMHDLSCCPPLPAPAPTDGTEGALVQRELPSSNVVTYQQFTRDLYQERLYNADKYKYHNLGSSILMKDCSNLEWKSIYNQDYQHQMGVHGGFYTEEIRPSPVFPEESRFNYSRWVSEYADSYSIFLKRLDWSSPISAQWLPFGKDARWTPRWKESIH